MPPDGTRKARVNPCYFPLWAVKHALLCSGSGLGARRDHGSRHSQNIQTRHSPRATYLSIHHQIQQESCHIFFLLSLHGPPYPGDLRHENEHQTSEPEYSPKLLEARSSIIRLGLLTPLLAIRSACLHLRDIPIYPDTPWFV
jgi:hypothetical protein